MVFNIDVIDGKTVVCILDLEAVISSTDGKSSADLQAVWPIKDFLAERPDMPFDNEIVKASYEPKAFLFHIVTKKTGVVAYPTTKAHPLLEWAETNETALYNLGVARRVAELDKVAQQ